MNNGLYLINSFENIPYPPCLGSGKETRSLDFAIIQPISRNVVCNDLTYNQYQQTDKQTSFERLHQIGINSFMGNEERGCKIALLLAKMVLIMHVV